MAAKEKHLAREQIAIIHVAMHQLGMADEDYRVLLLQVAGVKSSTQLNETGFKAVMLRFEALGFKSHKAKRAAAAKPAPAARPRYGHRDGMATPGQIELIRSLWTTWHGSADERACGRWMESKFGVSDLRFANAVTAQKATEGLKAMLARRCRPSGRKVQGGAS